MHQPIKGLLLAGVSDDQAVFAQDEQVAAPRDGRSCRRLNEVGWVRTILLEIEQQGVDLAGFKPGDAQIEPDFGKQDLQLFQFNRKRLSIPTGPLS